jgi:hypothetical protein
MNQSDTTHHAGGPGTAQPFGDRLDKEASAAGSAYSDMKDTASKATEGLGEQAAAAAESARKNAASHMSTLAQSVRRAADDYKKSEPGIMADLMEQAADGVDAVASAVSNKSTSQMVHTARDYGRSNPVAMMLGGAVLGFAISRLATAATSSSPVGGERPSEQGSIYPRQGGFHDDT